LRKQETDGFGRQTTYDLNFAACPVASTTLQRLRGKQKKNKKQCPRKDCTTIFVLRLLPKGCNLSDLRSSFDVGDGTQGIHDRHEVLGKCHGALHGALLVASLRNDGF